MGSETKKEALLVFLLLAFIFAYFYHDPWWNGNSRIALTYAIVQEGRLEINSFHDSGGTPTGDKAFYNDHYYTDKAIGTSLVAAIIYFPIYHLEQLLNINLASATVKYLLTLFSIGLPSAAAGTLMYLLCKQVSGSRLRAYAAVIFISLGTMIFPYSITFFGHQLAGSLLFGAFFLIYQQKVDPGYQKWGISVLTGFLLGFAFLTEYTIAPIVLVLSGYFIYAALRAGPTRKPISLLYFGLGASIPAAMFFAYNLAVYGSPFSLGYSYVLDPVFQQGHAQGLMGIGWPRLLVMFYLTLHPAMGLFWQSPVLLLSMAGIGFMGRQRKYRAEAIIALTAFLSLLLINSGHYMWWGGDTFGPRHLIPMLPFLCLPLVFLPNRWFVGTVVTGVISVVQMFIVVTSRMFFAPETPYQNIGQQGYFAYSSIYNYCLNQILNGAWSTNLGNKLGLGVLPGLLPPFVVLLIISLVFISGRSFSNQITPPDKTTLVQG